MGTAMEKLNAELRGQRFSKKQKMVRESTAVGAFIEKTSRKDPERQIWRALFCHLPRPSRRAGPDQFLRGHWRPSCSTTLLRLSAHFLRVGTRVLPTSGILVTGTGLRARAPHCLPELETSGCINASINLCRALGSHVLLRS